MKTQYKNLYGNEPFWQIRSEPSREKYEKQKWSQNGPRNEPSTSRHHRSARNFATILMAPTVLRVTNFKNPRKKKRTKRYPQSGAWTLNARGQPRTAPQNL